MNIFDLVTLDPSEIIVGDRILSSEKETSLINKMANSIKEVGLINPIQITEDNKLINGFIRIKAMEKLKQKIPCFIIKEKPNDRLKYMEIDENLIRRNLSPWQRSLLLKEKKKIYEKMNPTSTKAFKSKNNAKKEEERETTEKSFSEVAAEEMDCSEKTIINSTNKVEKIEKKNPKTIDLLSIYDKNSKTKLKGVEIDFISNLSVEELKNLNSILDEKRENNEKFKISEILTDKNKSYSKNEQLNMILEFDIAVFKGNQSQYDTTTIELIKSFRESHKVDFTDTITNSL